MQKFSKILLWVGGIVLFGLVVVIVLGLSFSKNWLRTSGSSASGVYQKGEMMLDAVGGMPSGVSYGTAMIAPEEARDVSVGYNKIAPDESQPAKIDRLIIKTGSLSMVVKDVKAGVAQIAAYVEKNGGFVVSSNVGKDGVSPYGEIIVRIPAKIFDQSVSDVKALGQIESERVDGQDVTEEYVDLDSQLKNLRAAEAQFLQIMQRAVKIEDVLAVQRELTNVRGRIESIQGRMKYLEQSANLSTLTVYLSTDPSVLPTVDDTNKWKPWAEVKSAARSLLEVGKGLANLIIWLAVYIPLWIVIGLVVWIIVRVVNKRKKTPFQG